jgi:hypothetical protein
MPARTEGKEHPPTSDYMSLHTRVLWYQWQSQAPMEAIGKGCAVESHATAQDIWLDVEGEDDRLIRFSTTRGVQEIRQDVTTNGSGARWRGQSCPLAPKTLRSVSARARHSTPMVVGKLVCINGPPIETIANPSP